MHYPNESELHRPTGGHWVVLCNKNKKKINMLLQNIYTEPIELALIYPTRIIAELSADNPNKIMDSRVIQAAPDLYWACVVTLQYLDSLSNNEPQRFSLEDCTNLLRNAVRLAQEGLDPSFIKELKEKNINPMDEH